MRVGVPGRRPPVDPGGPGNGQGDYSLEGRIARDQATKNQNEAQKALQDAQRDSNDASLLQKASGISPTIPTPTQVAGLYAQLKQLNDAFQAYQAMANQDKALQPQLDANGGPGLPVHCQTLDAQALAAEVEQKQNAIQGKPVTPASPDAGQCLPCYTVAEQKVNARRVAFERLRIILVYTKAMASNGEGLITAFGTAGGSVAAFGAQVEIQKVEKSMKDFNAAYDSKYIEILANLKSSLDEFGGCEQKYFNNPDWYARYGFIYYQFMADKYKRI